MEERVKTILERLRTAYPEAVCELDFGTPFQLLVAVILSAQCTDKRVNKVTEKLFKVYSTPEDFARLTPEALIPYIFSCGFYNNKAKHIIEASRDIVSRFDGRVPDNLSDLQTLAGVGRKTANVVYANAFGGQAIAVDTHVFRVSNRIGLAHAKNVLQTELQLMEAIDPSLYAESHHLLIFLGRYTCHARKPDCGACSIAEYCAYPDKSGPQG